MWWEGPPVGAGWSGYGELGRWGYRHLLTLGSLGNTSWIPVWGRRESHDPEVSIWKRDADSQLQERGKEGGQDRGARLAPPTRPGEESWEENTGGLLSVLQK